MSLFYLTFDLVCEWNSYNGCYQPIHKWLLISYCLVVLSRVIYIGGALLSRTGAGAFLLDLRQKSGRIQLLMTLIWVVVVPCFTAWSLVGSYWIYDVVRYTPQCMPGGAHLGFLGIWQGLSYFWIIVHGCLGGVAWLLEKRLQRTEGELRQLEDPDTVARWGNVSQLQGYTSMPTTLRGQGLSPSQILGLAGVSVAPVQSANAEESECPICLNAIKAGDQVRQLAGCSHSFHRSCIDLWLVRRADCPLCKGKVDGAAAAVCPPAAAHGSDEEAGDVVRRKRSPSSASSSTAASSSAC